MKKLFLSTTLLIVGFSLGWHSNTWLTLNNRPSTTKIITQLDRHSTDTSQSTGTPIFNEQEAQTKQSSSNPSTVLAHFIQLLNKRRFQDAMQVYQQQKQISEQATSRLKDALLTHLAMLLKIQDRNNFSELSGLFLSTYYEDIDVLLLLAEFNQTNSAYMEAINVYQRASTYAYNSYQQQTVQTHFTEFVSATDQFYTEQQDWFALSNFYAHIEAAGLLTPALQYRQALAHLRSGNRASALEQLQQLQNDSQVGAQARIMLKELKENPADPNIPQTDSWKNAQSIALEKKDNHYLIQLNFNHSDDITLLIDTGASITTISNNTFNRLNSQALATLEGVRVFQTANGPTQGSIYTIPHIKIGPYQLSNIQIAILDFTLPEGVDGLLGMNVLGQYRFQIDHENSRLLLNKK